MVLVVIRWNSKDEKGGGLFLPPRIWGNSSSPFPKLRRRPKPDAAIGGRLNRKPRELILFSNLYN